MYRTHKCGELIIKDGIEVLGRTGNYFKTSEVIKNYLSIQFP